MTAANKGPAEETSVGLGDEPPAGRAAGGADGQQRFSFQTQTKRADLSVWKTKKKKEKKAPAAPTGLGGIFSILSRLISDPH